MPLILIVDDDPSTLALLEVVFQKEGYRVIKASGGHEAIALARKYRPKLILLDMMMPDLDGLGVCKIVREDPEIGLTPIIMLTAARAMDKKLQSLQSGADEYLTKPVHPEELRIRVRRLLDRAAMGVPFNASQEERHVFAVIGASGAAGTTTIGLNLAASLIDDYPDTVLAELVPGCSSVASQLGLEPSIPGTKPALADLQKNLLTHSSGLSILPLPSMGDASPNGTVDDLQAQQIPSIVCELSSSFRCIFLDLGNGFNTRVQAALPYVNHFIVVMRAELLTLPKSVDLVKLLIKKGVPWEQIHIALVAFAPHPYFLDQENSKQMLQAHGIPNNVLMYVPSMRRLIHAAYTQQVPMVLVNPYGQALNLYFKDAMRQLVVKNELATL